LRCVYLLDLIIIAECLREYKGTRGALALRDV